MARYKILVEYDGTNFCGWQKQKDKLNPNHKISVQEVLENSIFQLFAQKVEVVCCGRTDAGVHAIAQVAHFDLERKIPAKRLLLAINHFLLKEDVIVLSCKKVKDNFHARFDAKLRYYRYVIVSRRAPLKLDKNRAWHVPVKLDLKKMRQASQCLLGEHDFSSFRDKECQSKTPFRNVEKISIRKNFDKIIIDIAANAFLHHMVRNIVGTLVFVGREKILVDDVAKILAAKNRQLSGPNAPACGLFFLKVKY